MKLRIFLITARPARLRVSIRCQVLIGSRLRREVLVNHRCQSCLAKGSITLKDRGLGQHSREPSPPALLPKFRSPHFNFPRAGGMPEGSDAPGVYPDVPRYQQSPWVSPGEEARVLPAESP